MKTKVVSSSEAETAEKVAAETGEDQSSSPVKETEAGSSEALKETVKPGETEKAAEPEGAEKPKEAEQVVSPPPTGSKVGSSAGMPPPPTGSPPPPPPPPPSPPVHTQASGGRGRDTGRVHRSSSVSGRGIPFVLRIFIVLCFLTAVLRVQLLMIPWGFISLDGN